MKKLLGIFVAAVWLLLPLVSFAQNQRSDDDQRHDQAYGTSHGRWEGRLSTEDQGRFDSYYSRWLDATRTNNRDEIASMESRMRDVMAHYSIPSDVPFAQIASNPNQGYGASRRGEGDSRHNIPRFSGDDATRFRSYYSRWQQARRTNNRDEIASMEGRMQDVMNHHNIPSNVSYDDVMNMLNGNDRD